MWAMTDEPLSAELHKVSLERSGNEVLKDISVQLNAQGGCALVGESGSGKSTLLALLMGLLRPGRGYIKVLGEDIPYANLSPFRRRMGYAIQETGLFPHLSVYDNLALPGRLANLTDTDVNERIEELCQLLQLHRDLLARYPHALSGGQAQRAGIARALLLRPRLLLLDEPFSGLDVLTRHVIYEQFMRLCEAQKTAFILVTHDLAEARDLCEQLMIIREGRLEQHGPTASVLRAPGSAYVEQLVRRIAGASQ